MTASFTATGWVSRTSGTLLGLFTLHSASGWIVHGCGLHEKNGKRWISLPGRPVLDREGRQLTSPETNKLAWAVVVEIERARSAKFQTEALAAVDRLLKRGQGSQKE